MSQDQFETKSKAIFSRLPQAEPSAFFAARVSARATKGTSREVWLWRWVAAVSLAAVIGLTSYIQLQPKQDLLFTYEPYVIQVDFNESEILLVDSAEIELPEGVTFVSKNQAVKNMKSLRLPLSARSRGRLPFVVISERAGDIPLQVKMYNADDELIHTKTLTLHFEKKG